jgi:hypothetical protein
MPNSEVDRMFKEFVEQHKSGGSAEPLEYLRELEGTNRAELAALIAGYLERAPRRQWNAEAFRGSAAERAVEEAMAEPVGAFSALLVSWRNAAKLRRDQVVARVAGALGVTPNEEKVAFYYHRLERGFLDPRNVSSRVFEALAGVLDQGPESLREAAANWTQAMERPTETFARRTMPSDETVHMADAERTEPSPPGPSASARGDWDEVDRLFLGGD